MSKKQTGPMTSKHNTLDLREGEPSDTHHAAMGRLVSAGVASNASTVASFAKGTFGDAVDLTATFRAMQADSKKVQGGDLSGAEAMLSSQMAALNAIFGEMARRSALNIVGHIEAADRYMRLALRAQSQCRATAETLAVIKQGPPIFARQANVAHGPQQVNNATMPPAPRASESTPINQPEQLESSDGERLDTGAASTASRGDSALEAVGAKHRPDDA